MEQQGNYEDEVYKENILDHYRNPHNKKKIPNSTFHVLESNTSCGDEIEFFVKIKQDKIEDIGFTGRGCAISQASTSMLTDFAKGKTIQEAKKISEKEVLEMLGIEIGAARMNCAMLPLRALHRCLDKKGEKK